MQEECGIFFVKVPIKPFYIPQGRKGKHYEEEDFQKREKPDNIKLFSGSNDYGGICRHPRNGADRHNRI